MAHIDAAILAVAPKADPDFVRSSLAVDAGAIAAEYGLTGATEQAQLLAHMSVESGGFRAFAENLNYSAERITQVFHARFPTAESARPYEHKPRAFANKVYGGRYGNKGPDDGWLYRGSGGLQHTFASEFERVEHRTGLPVVKNPDMLRDKRNTEAIWRAACSYMVDRGALAPARAGDTTATTVKINGGTNGLADRRISVARAAKALGGRPIEVHGLGPAKTPAPPPPAEPVPPPQTGTPATEHADPTQRTTVEVEQDERGKRNKAITGTAAGAPGGGAASTGGEVPKQGTDWALVGGVAVLIELVGAFFILRFWRSHAEAKAALERQQLQAVAQRVAAAA